MSAIATAATAVTSVHTAYKTASKAVGSVSELMSTIDDLKDRGITSLSQYAKSTLITSRVYIEDELSSEDITPKLLKLLSSIYSGMIMCSVGLNNIVAGGRTVRSMMSAIATENQKSMSDLLGGFGDATPSLESKENVFSASEKDLKSESQRLFTGHLLEMNVPTPDGKSFPLYFYVQLLPNVIPQVVMQQFLETHTSPPMTLRWAMWKAGEISFWKDFVFEVDRVNKRKKALKADKDGILREVEDHRAKMLKKKMANYRNKEQMARQRNLCNSIVICTKRTIDNVCKDLGINLKSFSQRQALIEDMFAIILVVVDTNYGTVDMYMNGIEGRGEYNAKMIDSATKSGGNSLDMKELLALISAGSMPRF